MQVKYERLIAAARQMLSLPMTQRSSAFDRLREAVDDIDFPKETRKLRFSGHNTVQGIKAARNILGLGLVLAKQLVQTQQVVDLPSRLNDAAVNRLQAAGFTVIEPRG